jgi:hypothetical protein
MKNPGIYSHQFLGDKVLIGYFFNEASIGSKEITNRSASRLEYVNKNKVF